MFLDWAKENISPDFTTEIQKSFEKKFHGTIPAKVVTLEDLGLPREAR